MSLELFLPIVTLVGIISGLPLFFRKIEQDENPKISAIFNFIRHGSLVMFNKVNFYALGLIVTLTLVFHFLSIFNMLHFSASLMFLLGGFFAWASSGIGILFYLRCSKRHSLTLGKVFSEALFKTSVDWIALNVGLSMLLCWLLFQGLNFAFDHHWLNFSKFVLAKLGEDMIWQSTLPTLSIFQRLKSAELVILLFFFGLGGLMYQMVLRVAVGIFAKAADTSLDSCSELENNFLHDDFRNPALLSDWTGDVLTKGALSSVTVHLVTVLLTMLTLSFSYLFQIHALNEPLFTLGTGPVLLLASGYLSFCISLRWISIRNDRIVESEIFKQIKIAAGLVLFILLFPLVLFFKWEILSVTDILLFASGFGGGVIMIFIQQNFVGFSSKLIKSFTNQAHLGVVTSIHHAVSLSRLGGMIPHTATILAVLGAVLWLTKIEGLTHGLYGLCLALLGGWTVFLINKPFQLTGLLADIPMGLSKYSGSRLDSENSALHIFHRTGAIFTGLDGILTIFILGIGSLLMAYPMLVVLPHWFFIRISKGLINLKGFSISASAYFESIDLAASDVAAQDSMSLWELGPENLLDFFSLEISNGLFWIGIGIGIVLCYLFFSWFIILYHNSINSMVTEIRKQVRERLGNQPIRDDYSQFLRLAFANLKYKPLVPIIGIIIVWVFAGPLLGISGMLGLLLGLFMMMMMASLEMAVIACFSKQARMLQLSEQPYSASSLQRSMINADLYGDVLGEFSTNYLWFFLTLEWGFLIFSFLAIGT